MNSHERFEAVLKHQKPDKMPFYFPTMECSVASQILGRDINSGGDSLCFKEDLSWLDGKNAHDELVCRFHEDTVELNRKLKADVVREALKSSEKPSKKLDDFTLLFGKEDGPHKIKRFYPESQTYGIMEDTTGPGDTDELADRLKSEMNKDYRLSDDELSNMYKDQLRFKKLAEPYFPVIFGGLMIGLPMYSTVWLEATVLESDLLAEYFIYQAGAAIHQVKWLNRQGFKWINGGYDIASNNGPVYSPLSFKKIMVKPLKMVADECNKYDMLYCYRTDGNTWAIFDYMFQETGIQAYGEVDRDATMTVGRIRERSSSLVILGNVSSANLNNCSEEDVRKETRAGLLESEGYNYIAGPSNAVLHNTPVENVYAMIDEIEKFKP